MSNQKLKRALSRLLPAGAFDLVVLANTRRMLARDRCLALWYRRKHVGIGSFLERDVQILGWRSVQIGRHTIISSGSWINVNNERTAVPRVVIGDYSYVGRRNFFSSAQLIEIGPYFLSGMDCRFLGANHIYSDPMRPYVSTGVTDQAVLRVGANCWFGTGVTVLGHVEIGHGCVIGAGSVVIANVAPFSLVVGNPARIIKRYDIASGAWVRTADFTQAMATALPTEVDYLKILARTRLHMAALRPAAGPQRGDLA